VDRRSIVRGALAACWANAARGGTPDRTPPPIRDPQPKGANGFAPHAQTLIVIRHAEKPDDQKQVPGIDLLGEIDSSSLSVRGWQRAGALAVLFGPEGGRADYPTPDVVIAANPNASPKNQRLSALISKRPHQTIVPLCQRLEIKHVLDFGVGDEAEMLKVAYGKKGVVLICWEHYRIVEALLPDIAKGQDIRGLPTKWDNARFDVVLRFDRPRPDAPWAYRQLFPKLLAGDTSLPL
jgi:hypothetical protein